MKRMTRKEIFATAVARGQKPPIAPLTREERIMAEHAEREANGGSGGASSWNDLTDKPFGETEIEKFRMSDSGRFTGGTGHSFCIFINSDVTFSEGDFATVVFDGVEYSGIIERLQVPNSDTELLGFGNEWLCNKSFEDNSEDMFFEFPSTWGNNGTQIRIFRRERDYGSELVPFEIVVVGTETKTLDPKYLPSGGGGDSGVIYVTLNVEMEGTMQAMLSGVCDKTYSEIKSAFESAKPIVCVIAMKDYCREYRDDGNEMLVHTGYTNEVSGSIMCDSENNHIRFSRANVYSAGFYIDESNTVFMESPE